MITNSKLVIHTNLHPVPLNGFGITGIHCREEEGAPPTPTEMKRFFDGAMRPLHERVVADDEVVAEITPNMLA